MSILVPGCGRERGGREEAVLVRVLVPGLEEGEGSMFDFQALLGRFQQ